jgi:hypothetical protein
MAWVDAMGWWLVKRKRVDAEGVARSVLLIYTLNRLYSEFY